MKIHCKYTGIKGFVTVYDRAVRYRYMITEEAKRRMKILQYWQKHGLESAMDAFGTKRRTLFDWQSKFRKGGNKPEALNPQKRKPKHLRKRSWDVRILEEIKSLRNEHPNLGAEKIHPLLLDFCDSVGLKCPGSSTIERLIVDLGGLRRAPEHVTGTGRVRPVLREKALRKPKNFKAEYPGHCLALDTIEKQKGGHRLYLITAIDIYTRTTFAIATKSHASLTVAHFFTLIMELFPYPIKNVLTDNGSEFKKNLKLLLKENNITHYHTYPKTPKMNAHCESFNGTIQEEFVGYHVDLLFADITVFNLKLRDYLLFYNTKRVHCAFQNKLTPFAVLNGSEYYVSKLSAECKNGWGQSWICVYYENRLYSPSLIKYTYVTRTTDKTVL